MRYMKGLNDWLERDVHNRHREIRRVNATVEELTHDLRGMQRRSSRRDTVRSSRRRRPAAPSPTTSSAPPQVPSFPVVPPGVQSVPVGRRRTISSAPLQRQPTMFYPVVPQSSHQSQPAFVFLPAVQSTHHRRSTQPNVTEHRPRRRP